jgi:uncharacterized membrane protein YedE/YeeE
MTARFAIIALAGILFGAGLAVSGMTDPARVIGFLDVTGVWDPTLLFVMAGAVLTFGVGLAFMRKWRGGQGWFGVRLPTRDNSPVDRSLVIGSLIFGIGWGLSGFCPGPAVANLAAWRIEALLFVAAMAVGMLAARLAFRVDP